MSCQKNIVRKIVKGEGDYCKDFFAEFSEESDQTITSEKGHERIEKRKYFLTTDIDWSEQHSELKNLNAIGMVRSKVTEGKKEREYFRYYITSLTNIHGFTYTVRKHWSVENQLHWCLDVIFREDAARARKNNSPLNMKMLRKTALSLLNKAEYGRLSKKMMFKTSLNPEVLLSIFLSLKK